MDTTINFLTLATLIVSVVLLGRQLERLRNSNRLIAAGGRFQARNAVFPLINNIELLHGRVEDYFERDIYERFYAGNRDRTLAYLALHQQYTYLAFFLTVRQDDPVQVESSPWLDRLILLQEFRHVHERESAIYPIVGEEVEFAIRRAVSPAIRWAADGEPSSN